MPRAKTIPPLRVLTPDDVVSIETALAQVGPNGQVHLLAAGGRLRYIRTVQSETALRPYASRKKRRRAAS